MKHLAGKMPHLGIKKKKKIFKYDLIIIVNPWPKAMVDDMIESVAI